MYGFFKLFFQYLHTQAKKKIVKHIRTCKPDHCIEKATYLYSMFNQEASSSADLQEHGDEHDIQTGPHLNLHSPPFDSPSSGPDQQHISCQQSSNAQEDFHHHLLLQKSRIHGSWVSPENVLVLEGKCHGKQDTGHPHK